MDPSWTAPGTPGAQVISAEAAWHIGDILRGVPPPANSPLGLAYKTGTSYGHRDAWAIGYDSDHVVGVWLGRPDGTPVPGAFGADVAAPMLFEAFQAVSPDFATPPPPPPATLLASNASLPQPLQRFRGDKTEGFGIAFPPDGAILARNPSGLVIRLRGGTPPFTLLADGTPIATRLQRRETYLPAPPLGFLSLSVIDAFGQSGRVAVELR
jgi:penicillin-binding protein 1C